MSLFSNDMRVATTATPSIQTQANVGQYGWTGADQGHYNQLIQYVDECRKIWINLEEKITYVETLIKQVDDIDAQVKHIDLVAANVIKLASETKTFRDQTSSMYQEMKPLIAEFDIQYADFSKKYTQVVQMHGETTQAAIAAAQSEIAAAQSAKDAAEIAEELRKGQVYRGTWNIERNKGYPPAPDTNSVWDITLEEDSIQYVYDGQTWFWGDRLLFLKDDNAFSQIESGSTVVSVNGKNGAVTLSAADVNAAPSGFGLGETQAYTVTDMDSDPLTWNGGKIGWVRGISSTLNKPEDRSGVAMMQRYQSSGTTSGVFITYIAGNDTYTRYWTGTAWRDWVKSYHTGNKPTPNELGAVSKSGDTITGSTFVDRGASAEPQIGVSRDGRKTFMADNSTVVGIYSSGITGKDPSWLVNRNLSDGSVTLGDNRSSTNINGKDTTFTYKGKKVYTEDFKPDALPSHGFGMGNKQGGAILAENFTEDKTRDFNKLLTAGEYTVSGEWLNGATNVATGVGHTGIVKVEIRNFGAGPSYIQTFKSISNGLVNENVRSGTGTAPNNINWTTWNKAGRYEQELGHRLTINRTNSTGPAYMCLVKREKRTDVTSGWYNFATIEMKQGDGTYDPNNPNAGQLAAGIWGARQWDNKRNRLMVSLRGAVDGNTKSEVVLYEDGLNLVCNGKVVRFNSVDLLVDNKKVYHEGLKPTAAEIGALPLTGGILTGPLFIGSAGTVFATKALGSTDLNTLHDHTFHGMYYQDATANATTARNYPINEAGSLIVMGGAYGACQEFTGYASGRKFVRGKVSAGSGSANWYPWKEIGGVKQHCSGYRLAADVATIPANGIGTLSPQVFPSASGINFTGGNFLISKTGTYRVDWGFSIEPTGSNQQGVGSVWVNGKAVIDACIYNYCPASGAALQMGTASSCVIMKLNAGDKVAFRVTAVNSTSVKIYQAGYVTIEEM